MHSDIKTVPVGMLETNCFLFTIDQTLYIIDPGFEAEKILTAARDFVYEQVIILLTHAHVDHISAVGAICKKLNVKQVFLHNKDQELYRSPANHLLPWIGPAGELPDVQFKKGSVFGICAMINNRMKTKSGGESFMTNQEIFPYMKPGTWKDLILTDENGNL